MFKYLHKLKCKCGSHKWKLLWSGLRPDCLYFCDYSVCKYCKTRRMYVENLFGDIIPFNKRISNFFTTKGQVENLYIYYGPDIWNKFIKYEYTNTTSKIFDPIVKITQLTYEQLLFLYSHCIQER